MKRGYQTDDIERLLTKLQGINPKKAEKFRGLWEDCVTVAGHHDLEWGMAWTTIFEESWEEIFADAATRDPHLLKSEDSWEYWEAFYRLWGSTMHGVLVAALDTVFTCTERGNGDKEEDSSES